MFGVVSDYVVTNPNRSEAEFTEGKFFPGRRGRPIGA